VPQNEFPVFTHTGDVEIVLNNGRKEMRYVLHKLILTQCSGFFEAGTSEEWSFAGGEGMGVNGSVMSGSGLGSAALARVPEGHRAQEKMRWRYELAGGRGEDGDGDDLPMLVQKVNTRCEITDRCTCEQHS
jgi:hypothetical protein